MSQHYATIKCDLYQIVWKHDPDMTYSARRWATQYKEEYLEYFKNLKNKAYGDSHYYMEDEGYYYRSKEYYLDRLERSKQGWKRNLNSREIYATRVLNGQHALWSGTVEHDLLHIGDHIYIPTLKEYKEINKVEVSPTGEAIYYIKYEHLAEDNTEETRLHSIEEWFKNMYPTLNSFNDLLTYQHPITTEEAFFNKTVEKVEAKLFKKTPEQMAALEKQKELITDQPKVLIDSIPDPQDISWEKTLLVCGIGAVMILAGMCLYALI